MQNPWDDPTIEMIPIITGIITQPSISGRLMTLQLYDRMWLLDNFTEPYTIAAGTNIGDAIQSLLALKVPVNRLETNFPDTAINTGTAALVFDTDAAIGDVLLQLAQLAGWSLYVDPLGVFTATSQPTTDDDPDLILQPGQYSIMYRPERVLGANEMINAVVYTNESGTDSPIRGYAQDDNPDSLTYVAMVGVHPQFLSSSAIDSQEHADLAAQTALLSVLGVSDQITVVMVPNHALDVGDILWVSDPDQDIEETLCVDSFSLPLRASGTLSIQCRTNVAIYIDQSGVEL